MGHLFNISINVQVLVAKTQQKNYMAVTHEAILINYYIIILLYLFAKPSLPSECDGR